MTLKSKGVNIYFSIFCEMSPKITPILEDPRTYVSNHGIVEIQYGIENSRTIDWQADFYDYVRDYMRKGERFSKVRKTFG